MKRGTIKRGPVRVSLGLTEMQAARVERAALSPASRTRSQRLQELLELGLQAVEARKKCDDLQSIGLGRDPERTRCGGCGRQDAECSCEWGDQ